MPITAFFVAFLPVKQSSAQVDSFYIDTFDCTNETFEVCYIGHYTNGTPNVSSISATGWDYQSFTPNFPLINQYKIEGVGSGSSEETTSISLDFDLVGGGSVSVDLVVPELALLVPDFTVTDPTCSDFADASVTASIGNDPELVYWFLDDVLVFSQPNYIDIPTPGLYDLIIVDPVCGNIIFDDLLIPEYEELVITIDEVTDIHPCPTGGSLFGEIQTSVSGGSGDLVVNWDALSGIEGGLLGENLTDIATTGSYEIELVDLIDPENCVISEIITVSLGSTYAPSASITELAPFVYCDNTSNVLQLGVAELVITETEIYNGNADVSWTPAGGNQLDDEEQSIYSADQGGTFAATVVFDGTNSCSAQYSVVVDAHNCNEPADLDCNGVINTGDLTLLLGFGDFGNSCKGCPEDLNNDGFVNTGDVALMMTFFGMTFSQYCTF